MDQEPESAQDAIGPDEHSLNTSGQTTSRRRFLHWMGRLGTVVVGSIAGAGILQESATGAVQPKYAWACCSLAYPPGGCPGSGSTFTCPSGGWVKRWWVCCYGGLQRGCGECMKGGTTCHNGTSYICSEGWTIRRSCG